MAEDKSIRFRIDADDSAFNEKMRQIQQRMRSFDQNRQYQNRAQQVTAGGSGFSDAAKRAFEREQTQYQQQLRKDDQFMSQQIQKKERHLDNIMKKKSMIASMDKTEADLSDKEIKRLGVKKKLVEEIGDLHRKQADNRQRLGGGDDDGGGGAGGGNIPPKQGGFAQLLKSIGVGAILKGALNATVAGMQDYATRDRTVLRGQRTALDYGSRNMREFSQGKGSDATFWSQERAQAAGLGLKEAGRQKNTDALRAGGAMGGGVLGGAAIGAAAGSVIPGVGTAIGAGVGGVIGGLGGFAGAGERGRAMMFDKERYQAMLMEQATGSARAMEGDIIARDPRKSIARQAFSKDVNKFSTLSRRLGGMSDSDLFGQSEDRDQTQFMNRNYGDKSSFSELVEDQAQKNERRERGWIRNQMNVGKVLGGKEIEDSEVYNQLNTILESGGTTAGGKAGAGRAAAMNRQLNLRNVGSVMGQISGAGGGADTDEATKKLLTEAVRLGVDLSKMPAEMERMIGVTAQLATAGGGFSAIDANLFGTTGDITKAGVEGGKTAFDIQKNKAKSGSGFEGQAGYGFFLGEAGKGAFGAEASGKIKKDSDMMNRLNQLSAGDLEKDPAELQAIADDLGISKESVLDGMRKKDAFKQTRTGEAQRAAEKFGALKSKYSPEQIQKFIETGNIPGASEEQSKELRSAYSEIKQQLTSTEGQAYTKLGQAAQRARAFGVSGEAAKAAGLDESVEDQTPGLIQSQLEQEKTQAAEGEKGAKARGQKFTIETLAEHADSFGKAAESTTGEMIKIGEVFEKIVESLNDKADITKPMEAIATHLSELAAKMAEDRAEVGTADTAPPEE